MGPQRARAAGPTNGDSPSPSALLLKAPGLRTMSVGAWDSRGVRDGWRRVEQSLNLKSEVRKTGCLSLLCDLNDTFDLPELHL